MLNSPNYYNIQNLSLDSKQHIFICSNIFVAPFAHLCHIWAISKHTTTTQDKNLVKIIEEYLLLKLLCCFSATSSSAGVVIIIFIHKNFPSNCHIFKIQTWNQTFGENFHHYPDWYYAKCTNIFCRQKCEKNLNS